MRSHSKDGQRQVRQSRADRVHQRRRLVRCALCACAWMLTSAAVQAGNGTFTATVRDMANETQSVAVALNKSVVVETTIEVTSIDVIAAEIVDVRAISPKQLLLTGKGYGQTNVVLWDAQDQQFVLEVNVELDLKGLTDTLRSIDPQSTVQARSVMGNIVLTGIVSSAERAARMVDLANMMVPPTGGKGADNIVSNHLEVAGEQQVLLRCVVAEVSRSASRELGINFFLAGDNVKDGFLVNQIGNINPMNIGAAAGALVTEKIPFLTGEDGIPLTANPTLSLGFPRAGLQTFVRAIADNNLASILAEPNMVVISGETASFLAGGEFPILVPQGNDRVTIEFKQFGVLLNFTPIVRAHQTIRLRVAPEVSEKDFSTVVQIGGLVVPGVKSRSVETTVELSSGQTIAIAGLLSEEMRGAASRVPGIGDVPILGALFRSVQYQRGVTELIILVTPEIVAPLDAHQIGPLPTDGVFQPSDTELYALGLLEGMADAGDAARGLEGDPDKLESEPDELSLHGSWGHAKPGDPQ